MDTSTNIQNNTYSLWTDKMKQERTKNKIKKYGQITNRFNNKTYRTFYTGIPDGVSLQGHDTGTFMISSHRETNM